MNEDQITTLAREYAEEIYPHEEGEDLGQMEFLRISAAKHIEASIKMLSRRFCLVEKSKICEAYKGTNKRPSLTDKEVYALESAISELESLIDGTLDEDYHKEQKSIINALKRIIKKFEKNGNNCTDNRI